MSARSTCASVCVTGTSSRWASPLTTSSSNGCRGEDVGEVDEPEGETAELPAIGLLGFRCEAPEVARARQQLGDPLTLLHVTVSFRARVDGEAEDADRVGLTRPE